MSALIGVVIVLALVICFFSIKSRKRRRKGNLIQHGKRPDSTTPGGSSTPENPSSPLVSSTASHIGPDGVPLTPPLRLGERKMLPPIPSPQLPRGLYMRNERRVSESPIRVSRRVKMTPRSEPAGGHGKDRLVPFTSTSTPVQASSIDENQTFTNSLTVAKSLRSSFATPTRKSSILTTPRHRRTEALVDINSLASPGPPPTRALPSTPPSSLKSPTRSQTSVTLNYGDVGAAIGTVPRNPAVGVVLQAESRDLCELTEEYARESRNSWGSWGGGCPGVAVTWPKRTRDVSSPVLEEGDLERLGGRY